MKTTSALKIKRWPQDFRQPKKGRQPLIIWYGLIQLQTFLVGSVSPGTMKFVHFRRWPQNKDNLKNENDPKNEGNPENGDYTKMKIIPKLKTTTKMKTTSKIKSTSKMKTTQKLKRSSKQQYKIYGRWINVVSLSSVVDNPKEIKMTPKMKTNSKMKMTSKMRKTQQMKTKNDEGV